MLNTYHKNRLNPIQQLAYDDLCKGIRSRSREISVRYVDDFRSVITAVNYDHPEFFYVNWLDRISYTVFFTQMFVQLNYIYNEQEIYDMNNRIKAVAKSIAGISNYGKALSIHDWFVENIKYDHKGLEQAIRSPGMFSAAGPLTSQKAVCEGISKLACYIMREKGIDSTVITGVANDGTPHAWNMLEVDGKPLYADITYDIGISTQGIIQRKYFLLSQTEIARDRTIHYY